MRDFQGDDAIQRRVAGFPDRAERADANALQQFELAQRLHRRRADGGAGFAYAEAAAAAGAEYFIRSVVGERDRIVAMRAAQPGHRPWRLRGGRAGRRGGSFGWERAGVMCAHALKTRRSRACFPWALGRFREHIGNWSGEKDILGGSRPQVRLVGASFQLATFGQVGNLPPRIGLGGEDEIVYPTGPEMGWTANGALDKRRYPP